MSEFKQYIEEFCHDAEKDIKNEKQERNYCIILYKCRGFHNETKYVHKVYKSLANFKKKGEKDMKEIDPSRGINVQLWFFD